MTDERKGGSIVWLALIPAALLGAYALSGSGEALWMGLAAAVCSGVFIGLGSRLNRRRALPTAARRPGERGDGSAPAVSGSGPLESDSSSCSSDSGGGDGGGGGGGD